MQTREITKTEWPSFFDGFSRRHQGWLATLEIMGPDLGAQIEERELAFEGITDEPDDAQGNMITIMAGGKTNVGSSRVDLQACKLEYSIVSPK